MSTDCLLDCLGAVPPSIFVFWKFSRYSMFLFYAHKIVPFPGPWTYELQRQRTLNVGFSLKLTYERPWRHMFNRFYILGLHSLMVGISDPACDLLPPWRRTYTCVLLPLNLLSKFCVLNVQNNRSFRKFILSGRWRWFSSNKGGCYEAYCE